MATFKRMKIQATVETAGQLLLEDQIGGAVAELRDRLEHLDLVVLAIEPKEEPAVEVPDDFDARPD
jgi:hypothetical protein